MHGKCHSRMKISVITDISVLRFYGYIGNFGKKKYIDKPKINQNLIKKYKKKLYKNVNRSIMIFLSCFIK